MTGEPADLRCPGCGGRNRAEAADCDFCERPLHGSPRRGSRVLGLLAGVMLLLVVIAVVLLNAGGGLPAGLR